MIIYFRYNIMRYNMINQAQCQEFSSETNWLWPEQLSLETWLLKCHLDIVSSFLGLGKTLWQRAATGG